MLLMHHILIGYDGSLLKREVGRKKEDAYFLFQVAVVLAKLGDEFSEDESHTLDKITDFFNDLLREGEIRP